MLPYAYVLTLPENTWALSGPQLSEKQDVLQMESKELRLQQRYCYPKINNEYSNQKGGILWTKVSVLGYFLGTRRGGVTLSLNDCMLHSLSLRFAFSCRHTHSTTQTARNNSTSRYSMSTRRLSGCLQSWQALTNYQILRTRQN